MEKGEGISLREKYDIKAFPTMLILDSEGTVINRIVGAMDAKKLMERVSEID